MCPARTRSVKRDESQPCARRAAAASFLALGLRSADSLAAITSVAHSLSLQENILDRYDCYDCYGRRKSSTGCGTTACAQAARAAWTAAADRSTLC